MKYLSGRFIIANHILLSIAAFGHGLKTYRQHFYIFTNLTLISSRFLLQKYNLLLSCFCKTQITVKFAINEKYYTYLTIIER